MNKDEAQPEQEPVNPLDDKTIAALIEASGIELDDDHVLEDQTIYYVDASTLFGLVRKVEKMFQPRMSTYTNQPCWDSFDKLFCLPYKCWTFKNILKLRKR